MIFQRKGLVLGFYEGEKDGDPILTKSAEGFRDKTGKSLVDLLKVYVLVRYYLIALTVSFYMRSLPTSSAM